LSCSLKSSPTIEKELGNINLTLSKTIENKKNSYHLLLNENKIPHSLCNKCKLTTSPEFNSNAEFLQLKADLQNEVTHLLDGLVSYNGEIIGKPNWPSAGTRQTTLLLFKLYMSNSFVCTDRISEYFKVSKDNILLIGTKILAALENNNDTTKLLSSLITSDIKLGDATEFNFVSECLTQSR